MAGHIQITVRSKTLHLNDSYMSRILCLLKAILCIAVLLFAILLKCVDNNSKHMHFAASYARNSGSMRQNSLPSGTSAYYPGADVGLFCGGRTYRECRPTGRALLLRESSGRQECGHAEW